MDMMGQAHSGQGHGHLVVYYRASKILTFYSGQQYTKSTKFVKET